MTSIAVVMPLFNKQAYVGAAIASVAAQDCLPDAVIVVDDASGDDSAATAAHALETHRPAWGATRTELLRHPVNRGPGAARNSGIERADGDLLLCLDADDRLRPDALRRIVAAMDAHDFAMAVIGYASDPAGEVFPEPGWRLLGTEPLGDEVFLLADPLRVVADPAFVMGRASNVAVRRSVLGAHRYGEAWLNEGVDLWYRVLRDSIDSGGRIGLIAAPLIRFRIVADSLSHRPCADWRAFEVPPTVLRYRDSRDSHDRAMAAMLATRWRDHALATLPPVERDRFLEGHRALLAAVTA